MIFGSLLRRPKAPTLEAFDRALDERRAQYRALTELAQKSVFVRVQREAELAERRATIARLHDRAREAARRGREDEARLYLVQKRALVARLAEDEADLAAARADAAEAQRKLLALSNDIEELSRERRRAVTGALAERVESTAAGGLAPRLVRRVAEASEGARALRGRLEAGRSLEDEDPGLVLELRALRAGG